MHREELDYYLKLPYFSDEDKDRSTIESTYSPEQMEKDIIWTLNKYIIGSRRAATKWYMCIGSLSESQNIGSHGIM